MQSKNLFLKKLISFSTSFYNFIRHVCSWKSESPSTISCNYESAVCTYSMYCNAYLMYWWLYTRPSTYIPISTFYTQEVLWWRVHIKVSYHRVKTQDLLVTCETNLYNVLHYKTALEQIQIKGSYLDQVCTTIAQIRSIPYPNPVSTPQSNLFA